MVVEFSKASGKDSVSDYQVDLSRRAAVVNRLGKFHESPTAVADVVDDDIFQVVVLVQCGNLCTKYLSSLMSRTLLAVMIFSILNF